MIAVRLLYRPELLRTDAAFMGAVPGAWSVADTVLSVRRGELVIPRLFAYPYPRALDNDLAALKARPLNDARAYRFCEDVLAWTAALGDLTPRAWANFAEIPDNLPVIVKGAHADKGRWAQMYADGRAAAIELRSELWRDTGMRSEAIVAREYVPLRRLGESAVGGCPPSEEWRIFVVDGVVVGGAPYWPPDDCETPCGPVSEVDPGWIARAVGAVTTACPSLRWIALDVGRTDAGRLYVIEVSDGQRAGIPDGMPDEDVRAMLHRMAAVLEGAR